VRRDKHLRGLAPGSGRDRFGGRGERDIAREGDVYARRERFDWIFQGMGDFAPEFFL
jgi:hypothetical protein